MLHQRTQYVCICNCPLPAHPSHTSLVSLSPYLLCYLFCDTKLFIVGCESSLLVLAATALPIPSFPQSFSSRNLQTQLAESFHNPQPINTLPFAVGPFTAPSAGPDPVGAPYSPAETHETHEFYRQASGALAASGLQYQVVALNTTKMAPPQNNHPLPAPPGQHNAGYQQSSYQPAQHSQRPTSKGRRARGFSFRSDHSAGSKENKDQLIETHREKEAKRLHTKADPTMALVEIEPGTNPPRNDLSGCIG